MPLQNVPSPRKEWAQWAGALDKWGLRAFTAWVLDAAGPLSLLGAQAIYLGQPFLRPLNFEYETNLLAQLLEDSDEKQAFVTFLREAASS